MMIIDLREIDDRIYQQFYLLICVNILSTNALTTQTESSLIIVQHNRHDFLQD